MDAEKFKSVLMIGETSSVEFKRCGGVVEHDVFESICAFLNRFGGDVYLGVLNDGTVEGVDAATAAEKMKNVINVVGNPNVFKPSPYIEVDSFVWEGKTVIRVHAPVSGDVHSYKGEIYDRMGEVDVKIRATAQIADLYMRKKGIYTEREVFPHLTLDDFRLDLLPNLRIEAQNHVTDGHQHPWTLMDDEQIFRSASLFDTDRATGESGFTLAAVLLLGKDETIRRICPQYETNALLRVQNVDRYDDRKIINTNLLESYFELLEFSRKYLPAPFYLEDDKRLNLREIIVREMVANLLIHREFTSAAPSWFVIERERMYTTNPCQPFFDGTISPETVHPRAKNPLIAGFFREIGRADRLGSGVRNLFKYCKEYGGEDPVFTEGNDFVISVSLKKLEVIRFPFEKPSIEGTEPSIATDKVPIDYGKMPIGEKKVPIESQKLHIGPEKLHIGPEKLHIGPEKLHITERLERLDLSQPTYDKIMRLYERFGEGQSFGRSDVCAMTEISERMASYLISQMLSYQLIVPTIGQGRRSYCFATPKNAFSSKEVRQ